MAAELGIPLGRCHYRLQLLAEEARDRLPGLRDLSAGLRETGREIAAERSLAERITYHPADFLQDEPPHAFDLALECDVSVFSEVLFRKVRDSLSSKGRFVILDEFGPSEAIAPPSRLHWAFEGSVANPDFSFPTASEVIRMLERAGFHDPSERALPPLYTAAKRFDRDLTIIEASRD